jgi:hypothetical protein
VQADVPGLSTDMAGVLLAAAIAMIFLFMYLTNEFDRGQC